MNAALQAERAKWEDQHLVPSSSPSMEPRGADHHREDEGQELVLDSSDDDGYDIVEGGLSPQGLSEMMQGMEEDDDDDDDDDEEDGSENSEGVVVDEVDGAGPQMPAPDSTHSQDDADEMARAIGEASNLPILPSGISGLSPTEESPIISFASVSSSPGKSPLRSPRRMTLRQSDVSPSLLSNQTLVEEEDEMAPLSLTASTSTDTLVSAPPTSTSPAPIPVPTTAADKVHVHQSEPEVDEMEEVDLSTGPEISHEE